ncbi:hypothetical protein LPB140_01895 [Sphingorhabdus lutea]|uniref:MerC domain-containing protein n=1 Tax=Sphingorhabdus lutea TaxID=1913578 RepID=A0A1L3J9I1_9SPHN|nr:MerC domain-containing protein [Sphingorhabdus lutea]APG61787.1 hypothetical protein LPB140_01895 [Sphingorhabdus lutea]
MAVITNYWRIWRWDGLGLGLSALCLAHCLATTFFFALMSSLGGAVGDPILHEIGLALAVIFGSLSLYQGVRKHGFIMPAAIGSLGIGAMLGALSIPHGSSETLFTMVGVGLLGFGHVLNFRASA